ncbi:MAG TPA: MBL fold metallo-hydrolase [Deltaproteobacteria bacterium]|nr:MBL fold metallo-hydrolase [Deltaproteobacteria bacterium]HPR55578.1 MBL fold metallo-hydrolase [Deltaproteobacteria bacterium]HXK48581.1 MBL fold metallo-hydrolase [Deltaproteobacteria bacterium]
MNTTVNGGSMKVHGFRVTFLGTGDAFGSGGRLQSSIHVDDGKRPFLIDCGATALLAMKRSGLKPDAVETILVSHLHGDHLCGIPFILRETQILSRRTTPLLIAGPTGTEDMIRTLMKTLFPGSWGQDLSFGLSFTELEPLRPCLLGDLAVTLFPATHTPGTNPHSVRAETGGRVIAYSGDTEWNPHLIEAARGADLFVCECFQYDGPKKNHLDYPTLLRNRRSLDAERIVLTHMNETMLDNLDAVEFKCAYDGMVIEL